MAKKLAPKDFKHRLSKFVKDRLCSEISTDDGQWAVKGFIDAYKQIFTISADTKVLSKILEIHITPLLLEFAASEGFAIVYPDSQNWYPDMSFVSIPDEKQKFAVDLKTTYRLPEKDGYCNGFTLGSHGAYFIDRESTKNIQFPYSSYDAHYCICIIYTRVAGTALDEATRHDFADLQSIVSVVKDFEVFVAEKWKIASDKSGSGNTANIGSITRIKDLVNENGVFADHGEELFDTYWQNHSKMIVKGLKGKKKGKSKTLTSLDEYFAHVGKQ